MYYVTFELGLGSFMYYEGHYEQGFPKMTFDIKKAAKVDYESAGYVSTDIQTTIPERIKIIKA